MKSDGIRLWQDYAEIRDGKVAMTDGSILIVMGVQEVTGQSADQFTETLYIDRKLWGLLKFPSAKLTAWDPETRILKNITSGTEIKLLNQAEYEEKNGNFPDWSVVIPDQEKPLVPVDRIGFDAARLWTIAQVWGIDPWNMRYSFYGADRGIVIDGPVNQTEGFALLMPVNLSKDFEGSFWPKLKPGEVPEEEETVDPEPVKEQAVNPEADAAADQDAVAEIERLAQAGGPAEAAVDEDEPEGAEVEGVDVVERSVGRFDYNYHGVCLNPNVQSIKLGKGKTCELHWAETAPGEWSYGYRFECGTAGSSAPVMHSPALSYPSEWHALDAAARKARRWFEEHDLKPAERKKLDEFLAQFIDTDKVETAEDTDISDLL